MQSLIAYSLSIKMASRHIFYKNFAPEMNKSILNLTKSISFIEKNNCMKQISIHQYISVVVGISFNCQSSHTRLIMKTD